MASTFQPTVASPHPSSTHRPSPSDDTGTSVLRHFAWEIDAAERPSDPAEPRACVIRGIALSRHPLEGRGLLALRRAAPAGGRVTDTRPEDLAPSDPKRYLRTCREHGLLATKCADGRFWCAFGGGHEPEDTEVYDAVARTIVRHEVPE